MDHDAWNQYLVDSIGQRAAAAEAVQGDSWDDLQSVFGSTVREMDEGLMDGFWSKAQLDELYGQGRWRAMRRFGVWQKGKCRACDNAAESRHNDATFMAESIKTDSADFPARAAAVWARVLDKRLRHVGLVKKGETLFSRGGTMPHRPSGPSATAGGPRGKQGRDDGRIRSAAAL